jgi:hypothetical protein
MIKIILSVVAGIIVGIGFTIYLLYRTMKSTKKS